MPGPNVLDLVGDIREAVERLPKDQLVDILVYVFKEYVVEGSPPLAAGPTSAEDDLAGMSFGEVMRSLQLRLDLPELELFDVQGERVSVRLQGRSILVEIGAARAEPGPPPPAPASLAPPAPVVVAPPPVAAAPRPVAVPLPTPASSPARPSPAAMQHTAPAASQQSGGSPSSAAPATPGASQQGAPAGGGRGGLLEID